MSDNILHDPTVAGQPLADLRLCERCKRPARELCAGWCRDCTSAAYFDSLPARNTHPDTGDEFGPDDDTDDPTQPFPPPEEGDPVAAFADEHRHPEITRTFEDPTPW